MKLIYSTVHKPPERHQLAHSSSKFPESVEVESGPTHFGMGRSDIWLPVKCPFAGRSVLLQKRVLFLADEVISSDHVIPFLALLALSAC